MSISSQRNVIIACAPADGIHTPSMSPYLPVPTDEIAAAAIAVLGTPVAAVAPLPQWGLREIV